MKPFCDPASASAVPLQPGERSDPLKAFSPPFNQSATKHKDAAARAPAALERSDDGPAPRGRLSLRARTAPSSALPAESRQRPGGSKQSGGGGRGRASKSFLPGTVAMTLRCSMSCATELVNAHARSVQVGRLAGGRHLELLLALPDRLEQVLQPLVPLIDVCRAFRHRTLLAYRTQGVRHASALQSAPLKTKQMRSSSEPCRRNAGPSDWSQSAAAETSLSSK